MKKLLLVIISVFITLTTTAANLNPFAYGLSSSYDPSTFTLTVNYSLNVPATKVELVIIDGATTAKIIDLTTSENIRGGGAHNPLFHARISPKSRLYMEAQCVW